MSYLASPASDIIIGGYYGGTGEVPGAIFVCYGTSEAGADDDQYDGKWGKLWEWGWAGFDDEIYNIKY